MCIMAYLNGDFVGYVRSVNHIKGQFAITPNRKNAKTSYKSMAELQQEIDRLTAYGFTQGYIFLMGN